MSSGIFPLKSGGFAPCGGVDDAGNLLVRQGRGAMHLIPRGDQRASQAGVEVTLAEEDASDCCDSALALGAEPDSGSKGAQEFL
jgi:hypothetical protein